MSQFRNRPFRYLPLKTALLVAFALLTLLAVPPAQAQQLFKLTASDAAAQDFFGDAVALNGNAAIVGAPCHYGPSDRSGSAYLFNVTTGQQVRQLIPSDPAADTQFGASVALSNNTAVIGASGNGLVGSTGVLGSAYVFDIATGQQLRKLTASDAATGDSFGVSVALSGDRALVGAFRDDNGTGSAYLFDVSTGQQIRKLTAADAATGDGFGISIALSGDIAVIGAYGDRDGSGNIFGSAYVFNVATGQQLFKLTASNPLRLEGFGRSVALSGDIALIGAGGDGSSTGGQSFGSAYVFDVTTGQQLFKLTASDRAEGDLFGFNVALDGNKALVGAKFDDDAGNDTGSVYLFNATTGQQLFKLMASDAEPGDGFGGDSLFGGFALALSGGKALIAATSDNDAGNGSGSAYLFDIGVPEPSTLLLSALALLPLSWRGFNRRVAGARRRRARHVAGLQRPTD